MAVNATPQYEKAEQQYRSASTPAEQIEAIQEMLRLIPKHKASEKLQAQLKTKLRTLRRDQARAKPAAAAAHADPFNIPAGGAAQIVVLGWPNTGKSSILAAVTNAAVKVADYPFSTAVPVPGMWHWQDVQLQLVDTPPIAPDAIEGNLVNLLHRCDLVLAVIDAAAPDCLDQAQGTLSALAARGLDLINAHAGELPEDKPFAKPGLLVATHADIAGPDDLATLVELLDAPLPIIGIDCVSQAGFDRLADEIWRLLNLIRVYTKRPGKPAEMTNPFALPAGSTVEDLAAAIHRDLPQKLKFARVWGQGRHDGQQVHRTEELRDRDVVELHE